MNEINDYLSKADEEIAKNVMYRVYRMPGPLFVENEVTPTPEPKPEPSFNNPFYVENITQETETLTISGYDSSGQGVYLEFPVEYSIDGTTWEQLGTTGATKLTRALAPGEKVYLRATTDTWYLYDEEQTIDSNCAINGVSKIGGNIMSLLYGSEFTGNETEITYEYVFSYIFAIPYGEEETNDVLTDTSELILPATTLSVGCYAGMFNGCTSLTTTPELPATTLTTGCYMNMFEGCTSLTQAPELPATTLTAGCYMNMFNGCKNLNYIKCLATDISADGCTHDWINEVSTSGTFVKNPSMTSWTTGHSGIPEGWTIENGEKK